MSETAAAVESAPRINSGWVARRALAKPLKFGDELQIEALQFIALQKQAQEQMKAWGKSRDYWEGLLAGRYGFETLDYLDRSDIEDLLQWLKEAEA